VPYASLSVAIGVAQAFMDWIFRLHFIEPPYRMMPFSFGTAALLILLTFTLGYLFGWVLAALWNRLRPVGAE